MLGFFALTVLSPTIVDPVCPGSTPLFNMAGAGLAVGILITPLIASIAEDAMYAVPSSLREASYGLGARKRTTSLRIVVPAAVSGIVAALIVGFSRAVGETMIVAIAAGGVGGAVFNLNPCLPGQTMTAAMTALAIGSDQVGGGVALREPLLRRPAAVRHDAAAEPHQRALRATHQERVLMAREPPRSVSAATQRGRAPRPRPGASVPIGESSSRASSSSRWSSRWASWSGC